MDLTNYLNQLGTTEGVTLDLVKQQRMPLVERVLEILSRSYLRLGILDEATKSMLISKVNLSIKNNEPITLILAVGGFKGAKVLNSPHINWAEVFHIDFLIKSLGEIALVYKPGLKLEFSGDDIIVSLMNNYNSEWTKIYNDEFDHLIDIFLKDLPSNIVVSNRPASYFYDKLQLENEVKNMADKHTISVEMFRDSVKHAENNFVFDGEENLTTLSQARKKSRLKRSIAIHDAWLEVDYIHRRDYLEGGVHIPVVHKRGMAGCYCIRSIKSSDVQFWEALGILERVESGFIPKLLSVKDMNVSKAPNCVSSKFDGLLGLRNILIF